MATAMRGISLRTASQGYVAPAEGFLSGLERGVGLYKSLVEQPQLEEEDRQYVRRKRAWEEADRALVEQERQRSTEEAEQKKVADAQAAVLAQEEARLAAEKRQIDEEQKRLSEQAQSAISVHGTDVPPEVRKALGGRMGALQNRMHGWSTAAAALAEKKLEQAKAALRRLTNAKTPGDADPADVRDALSGFGIPLEDVVSRDGGPSRFENALRQAAEGIQSGDPGKAVEAANLLFRRELYKGVGSPGADGTPVMSKEIIGFVPHPENPRLVSPVLMVRTVGNPQGYVAPVTRERSAKSDDPPAFIDIEQMLERGARMSELVKALNTPELRSRLGQVVSSEPPENKIDPALLFSMIPGINPKVKTAEVRAGAQVDAAEARAEAQKSAAEARARAQVDAAATRANTPARGGAGKGGSNKKYMTDAELRRLIEAKAGDYGLFYDAAAKQWKQRSPDGRLVAASPDSLEVLNRIKKEVITAAVQGKVGAPLRQLPSNKAELEDGGIYVAPDGSVVKHIGDGRFIDM